MLHWLNLFECAASEARLNPGEVAAIIIAVVALAVFGTAILLYIRQRQGLLTTLSLGNLSFGNILYRFGATGETERTEATQEDMNLGEITVTGGDTSPSRGEVTLEGAAANSVEADA